MVYTMQPDNICPWAQASDSAPVCRGERHTGSRTTSDRYGRLKDSSDGLLPVHLLSLTVVPCLLPVADSIRTHVRSITQRTQRLRMGSR